MARGTAAVKAGDWAAARAAFETAVAKQPTDAEARYYLGVSQERTGARDLAEASYRQALALRADFPEAIENLVALYVDARRFDDAIAAATQVRSGMPRNPELQLNLALAMSGKGDVEAANKAFEEALQKMPNDVRFRLAYAEHLRGAHRSEAALVQLREALRAAGENPALLGSVGFAFRTARAVPECIKAFDAAIARADNADFRTNRALCKLASKDRKGALDDLRSATTQDPSFAPAQYWLGSTLHEDGKFDPARAAYESYLKLTPTGPMASAADAKRKLAALKQRPERQQNGR
jgi:Flp pilus assembly protein TadD